MKLKQAIVSVMGRDALKGAVDEIEIEGVDRRNIEDMRSRLLRARRATPETLLQYLNEGEVKDVCELVGIPARGRRGALIEALLEGDGNGASRDAEEEKPSKLGRARAEPEPTHWVRPEEVQMSEQSIEKPELRSQREPGRPFRITRTELVWPGKYEENGNLVEPPRVSLPFQVIEVIEEGRTSREALTQTTLPLFGAKPKGPAEDGWRNKLIWGDNLLVEASLLKDFAGNIDLIYIDPPFATGLDFSLRIDVGDEVVTREASALEEKAYRDTWGRGIASYLDMIFHRLALAKDLMSSVGSIYIHIGVEVEHYVRSICDDLFGADSYRNTIAWKGSLPHGNMTWKYGGSHDSILYYTKSDDPIWNPQYLPHRQEYLDTFYKYEEKGRRYRLISCINPNKDRPNLRYEWKGVTRVWKFSRDRMERMDSEKLLVYSSNGIPQYKGFLDEMKGIPMQDTWDDIATLMGSSTEWLNYPTQKPVKLLERIVAASSNDNSVVLDFFCGSGTTLAAAENLGRRWIGCDLGRFAIHTTRKRLLDLQVKDADTGEERGCRPFEVLNLGRYERKYWQGITFGNEPRSDEQNALAAYVRFILELYKAQPISGTHVHGKKGGAFVHVGAVDAPVTIAQIEEASAESKARGGKELHILGWEFEMGLHDPITQYVRVQHGVIVRLVSIPRETMERRAVEAGDVQFFDLAYLEVEVNPQKGSKKQATIKVKLKDFVIPSTDLIPDEVRTKIKKWSDYIDYWAVDWDFRDDTFVNQWQTYRTRKDRSLALETPAHTYEKAGEYQILVKVVDIFGNDTSNLVCWEVK